MKTAVIYYSEHHGNTKRVIDAMATQGAIDMIDVTKTTDSDLSEYDLIGFASGIYFSKFNKSVLEFAEKNLPSDKKVFIVYTCGSKRESYLSAIESIVDLKGSKRIGAFNCAGYDTYGPFKLVGGINKNHPNDNDLEAAKNFFSKILKENA